MALVALRELRHHESRGRSLEDRVVQPLLQLAVEHLVAPEEARLQKSGADRHVGGSLADALLDGARGVADLEADIPERVEQILHHLLRIGRGLVGVEKQQVDVGERRQLAASVAADRDHRQMLAGGGVGGGIDRLGDEVVEGANELIHQEAEGAHHLGARGTPLETLAHLAPPGLERLLQDLDHLPALGLAALGKRPEALLQSAAVDDVPLVGDGGGHGVAILAFPRPFVARRRAGGCRRGQSPWSRQGLGTIF